MKKIIAVITARGGSKGIPKKNIKLFNGLPLIAYSINHALNSSMIDKVYVSTDSEEIKKISEKYGAECPFLRPKELAQDDSLDIDVFKHFLKWEKEKFSCNSELIVHVRPTSPVRPKGFIDECIKKISSNKNADSLRTVIKSPISPFKIWSIKNNNLQQIIFHPKIDEPYNHPRQKLPIFYWQTANIDIFKPRCIYEYNSMTGKIILPYVMDDKYAIDIDTLEDFKRAEQEFKNL